MDKPYKDLNEVFYTVIETKTDVRNIFLMLADINKNIASHQKFLQNHIIKTGDDCRDCKEGIQNKISEKTSNKYFIAAMTIILSVQLFIGGILYSAQ